jgi:hypothetical protein
VPEGLTPDQEQEAIKLGQERRNDYADLANAETARKEASKAVQEISGADRVFHMKRTSEIEMAEAGAMGTESAHARFAARSDQNAIDHFEANEEAYRESAKQEDKARSELADEDAENNTPS